MNTIKFSLSQSQIKSVRKHGLMPEVSGPVEGSKDLFYVEIPLNKAQELVRSVYRWAFEDGKQVGRCKIISMYSPGRRQTA